jgi:glucose/arabinose dehydrogenase
MEQPLHYWVPSIAPSGMAWYNADAFPQWRGDLLLGALVDREVRRVDLEDGRVVGEESLFKELDARIRDVRVGLDGQLYLLTDGEGGKLIRVSPASG